MTVALIDGLLDVSSSARDRFEVVRDQIGAILAVESANQQALAALTTGAVPQNYELQVYLERDSPIGVFREQDSAPIPYQPPVVNVSFEEDTVDMTKSNMLASGRVGIFCVDCYGYGVSARAGAGHISGDEAARRETARAASLVRKILGAGPWQLLGLRGLVGAVHVSQRKAFSLDHDERTFHVGAMRLMVQVTYAERSRDNVYPELEELILSVNRAEDGRLYFDTSVDLT